MSLALNVVLGVLLVAAAVTAAFAARRLAPLGDRAVAFDTLTSIITCGVLVAAALTGRTVLLEVALVLGLLGFIASVTVGRFIERKGP